MPENFSQATFAVNCIPDLQRCSKILVLLQGLETSEAPSKSLSGYSFGGGDLCDVAMQLLTELLIRMSSICGISCPRWSCFSRSALGGLVTIVEVLWWGLEMREHTCVFYRRFIRRLGAFLGRFTCGWLSFFWHNGNCNKLVGTWKNVQIFFLFRSNCLVYSLSMCRSDSSQILRGYHTEECNFLRLCTSS